MSQQLCFYFQYFLLYSALSRLRSPGISCSIHPGACPVTKCLSPKQPPAPGTFVAARWCAPCPAIPAGGHMHSLQQRWNHSQRHSQLQQGNSAAPLGSHQLMPLALACKGGDQYKTPGNKIPEWSLPCKTPTSCAPCWEQLSWGEEMTFSCSAGGGKEGSCITGVLNSSPQVLCIQEHEPGGLQSAQQIFVKHKPS